MPRKNQPGCPCCAKLSQTICVVFTCAANTFPVEGADVQISRAGEAVGSCTTDASGCCTIAVPQPGLYTLNVSVNGTVVALRPIQVPSAPVEVVLTPSSDFVCCGGQLVPRTLNATDGAGPFRLFYLTGSAPPVWIGTNTADVATAVDCQRPPTIYTPGTVGLVYRLSCLQAGPGRTFSLGRVWPTNGLVNLPPAFISAYFQSDGATAGCGPEGFCGACDGDSGLADPTSSSPFMITFSMAGPVVYIGPPIGPRVVISA